MYVPETEAETW